MAESVWQMKRDGLRLCDYLLIYVRMRYGTQAKAAKAYGFSGSYMSKILKGEKAPPADLLKEAGVIVETSWRLANG